MRQRSGYSGHLPFVRLASAIVIAAFAGACSGDSMRLADNPFSNPFSATSPSDMGATGSLNGAPAAKVKTAAIAAPKTPYYQALPGNVGPTGQLPTAAAPVASKVAPVLGSAAGWTATGGSPVSLGEGDTVEALSGRYGVPVAALRQVNGLPGNSQPSAGQQFIIPAFNPGSKASPAKAAPAVAAAPRTPRYESLTTSTVRSETEAEDDEPASKRVQATAVKGPDKKAVTSSKTTEKSASSASKTKATLAKAPPAQKAKTLPAAKPAVKTEEESSVKTAKAPVKAPAPQKAAEPTKTAKTSAKAEEPQTTGSVSEAKSGPEFRWPARGRVISGYGSRSPSGANDGINIALPEGTPVKATEGGTVAYAGEEIKGYGKMVLIRHPNGYVSAYAHNGDINVKRGDAVKRGQVIAKSGQTGNVTSPQLHFELRKGSDPVDPSKYLE